MSQSAASTTTVFDAPPSARSNRHYSIDLSLELERQLDLDSPLPTPAHPPPPPPVLKMPDIDPHVLAHIIGELRRQLADMSREREDLLAMLASANTKEAELQDAIQHITEKAMGLDEALSDARKKNRDDEEAISMLRTKVEESRRGLMRLQAESRRPMTIDMARANAPSAFITPPSAKRASFTPLTGSFNNSFPVRPNAHHRGSSVSESNIGLSLLDSNSVPNRRLSGFFGRSSPPREPPRHLTSSPDELEKLRKELRTTQAALEETRHELTEANEAREASDACMGALREFIAENNIGGATSEVKLPPLPAATTGDEADPNAQKKGWGFKLWKVDTAVKGAPGPASASTSNATASPVLPAAPPPNGAPLGRRLTGFFNSRASISSVASGVPSLAPLQPADRHRDSVYSLSDASSLAEPISPTSQVAGTDVRVREAHGSPEMAVGRTDDEAVKEVPRPPADDALSIGSVGI